MEKLKWGESETAKELKLGKKLARKREKEKKRRKMLGTYEEGEKERDGEGENGTGSWDSKKNSRLSCSLEDPLV